MKKVNFLIVIGLLSSISVFAQTFRVDFPPGYNKIVTQETIPGVDGSPFLDKEWSLGKIAVTDTSKIDSIMLRYNIYHKEMQYQHDGKTFAIGAPENLKEIDFNFHRFVYLPYVVDGVMKKDYFEILSSGKTVTLYVHRFTTVIPASYNPAMDVGEKNDRIKINEEFYVRKGDSMISIDKKGRNFLGLFSNADQQKVKQIIKEKRISFKNKKDLIELVVDINSNM